MRGFRYRGNYAELAAAGSDAGEHGEGEAAGEEQEQVPHAALGPGVGVQGEDAAQRLLGIVHACSLSLSLSLNLSYVWTQSYLISTDPAALLPDERRDSLPGEVGQAPRHLGQVGGQVGPGGEESPGEVGRVQVR